MKSDTREKVLQTARELVMVQGFNNTGIGQILSKAGVPKGSFYHYFPSKDDLGYALLNDYAERFQVHMSDFFAGHSGPTLATLQDYLENNLSLFEQSFGYCNCMFGNLGQELASQHEGFRLVLRSHFTAVEKRLAECFERAKEEGGLSLEADSRLLAELLFSGWEGAIMRDKVERSTEHSRRFLRHFFAHLPR